MFRQPLASLLLAGALLMPALKAVSADTQMPPVCHDFDFAAGTWTTRIRILGGSPGAPRWASVEGIVVVRPIFGGRANIEEIEASGSGRRFEGMTLRLYDPAARQWNLYWANSRDGQLAQPMAGAFRNGRGEFFDQERIDGELKFVRNIYTNITENSYRFEQAVSGDGGRTWQLNFTAALTRRASGDWPPTEAAASLEPAAQHAFDWQFGFWSIRMSRRLHPLTPSATWARYDGTVDVRKIWLGRANIAEINVAGASGKLQFLALRLFEPQTRQWTLRFASSRGGVLTAPMYGAFDAGRGTFYDQELDDQGKAVFDRFVFTTTHGKMHDEEALSPDGGRTWQPEFVNDLTRRG